MSNSKIDNSNVYVGLMRNKDGKLKKFSKTMWIDWLDGPCLMTSGANFLWLSTGVTSLTANQLKGIE